MLIPTPHLPAAHSLRLHGRAAMAAAMLLVSASCVPGGANLGVESASVSESKARALPTAAALAPRIAVAAEPALPVEKAVALNAALPISNAFNPAAASIVFRAGNPVAQMRALDCLTDAIYYEARSESEDGQRAVAQVVLNRVRHPAYPNSVCGVVYQGPMRAGGGCQFSFTCDGSMRFAPREPALTRARRIAAQALAGKVHAPVGHATHYHTYQVFPHWAPSLVKAAVIGSHIFYRFGDGTPSAFRARYAGVEPVKAPVLLPYLVPGPKLAVQMTFQPVAGQPVLKIGSVAPLAMVDDSIAKPADALPPSTIRAEYRNSGRIREKPLETVATAEATTQPAAETKTLR